MREDDAELTFTETSFAPNSYFLNALHRATTLLDSSYVPLYRRFRLPNSLGSRSLPCSPGWFGP